MQQWMMEHSLHAESNEVAQEMEKKEAYESARLPILILRMMSWYIQYKTVKYTS